MEKICKYCGQEYNNWPAHLKNCQKYIEYKNSVLTKAVLEELYLNKEMSIKDICKHLNLSSGIITQSLKNFKITIRTTKETRKTASYINKTKETCRRKFGADYANCKNSNIADKSKEAVLKKYGVSNVFKDSVIKEKIRKTNLQKYGFEQASKSDVVKQKVRCTSLQKYGVENASQNKDIKNRIKQTRKSNNSACYNSPTANNFFQELLNRLQERDNVYCAITGKEYAVMSEDKVLYFYDFVDTKRKKCIEFNGNYWHANPKMYESTWINPHNNKTAQQIWEQDNKKKEAIQTLRNFDYMVVWEQDVKKDMETQLQLCLKFLINKS